MVSISEFVLSYRTQTLRELLDMFLENHCHTQFSISALKALNNCIIANADAQHVALSPDVNIWDNLLSILPEADKYGLRCIPKSPAIPAEDGTRDSVNELRRMARLIKLVTSSLGRLAGTNIEYAEKMWENPQYAELLSRLLGLCFEDLSQATDNTLLDPEVAIASNVFILFYNSLAKLGCSRACNCTGEENEGCVFKGKTNSMLDEACSHGASVYRMNPNFTSISSNSFKLVMYYDWFGNLPEPVMSQKSEHLMGLLSVLDNSQQEEEISHLLVVAHYIASKHVQAKCRLKQMCDIDGALQTKKPIKDMEWPLQLCTSRLQSLNSVSKRFAGEFIYELCDLQGKFRSAYQILSRVSHLSLAVLRRCSRKIFLVNRDGSCSTTFAGERKSGAESSTRDTCRKMKQRENMYLYSSGANRALPKGLRFGVFGESLSIISYLSIAEYGKAARYLWKIEFVTVYRANP